MKAKEFDEKFDSGVNVTKYPDRSEACHPEHKQRRVNVDLPDWMIESLDNEAKRLGVTRQSVIKFWIARELEKTTVAN